MKMKHHWHTMVVEHFDDTVAYIILDTFKTRRDAYIAATSENRPVMRCREDHDSDGYIRGWPIEPIKEESE